MSSSICNPVMLKQLWSCFSMTGLQMDELMQRLSDLAILIGQ